MLSYQYGSTLCTVSFKHSAFGSKFLSTYCNDTDVEYDATFAHIFAENLY